MLPRSEEKFCEGLRVVKVGGEVLLQGKKMCCRFECREKKLGKVLLEENCTVKVWGKVCCESCEEKHVKGKPVTMTTTTTNSRVAIKEKSPTLNTNERKSESSNWRAALWWREKKNGLIR